MKILKDKGLGEKRDWQSVVAPKEYVDAIRCNLANEMQKDFEAQKEKLALDMKQEFEAQKDKLVDDVIAQAFTRLCQMFPNMVTETLGQVVASSMFVDP